MGPIGDLISPKKLKPQSVPQIPQREDVQAEGSPTKKKQRQRIAGQQGRGATILTGGQGVQGDDSTGIGAKKLLGV